MAHIFSILKKLLPWAVACGIFFYLFHLYPPRQVWEAAQYVNILPFLAFALFYFIVILAVDSFSTKVVLSRFATKVAYSDILTARGVTYLIMVLSYPASQGAFAYFLKRRYGIPIFRALGIFLFMVIVDLLWVTTLALVGSFFEPGKIGNVELQGTIQSVALCLYGAFFFWIAFWHRIGERMPGLRWLYHHRFALMLRKRDLFHIFEQCSLRDYLRLAVMRIPIHVSLIISMYIVVLTFNTHVPFAKILGNIPIILFIGTLPITPGGLGTVNAAMVELLAPAMASPIFAEGRVTPAELMFTITLLWMFANYLLKIGIGFLLLNRVSKDLFSPPKKIQAELKAEHPPHIESPLLGS